MRTWSIPLLLALSSCSTSSYLWQAAGGQMELLNRSHPIRKVLNDERTPPDLKRRLEEVARIKQWGETQGLKPTRNYEDYVELDRPYVVWSVTACEKLAFKPKTWSFPLVGSFSFLGWFSEEGARAHSSELAQEGYDVHVRGVTAYSTVGWFKDPVISTMVRGGRGDFANLILHESVHATLYIDDQSAYNESLASFVADALTPEYFRAIGEEPVGREFVEKEAKDALRAEKVRAAIRELEALYAGPLPDAEKLSKKSTIVKKLQSDLGQKTEPNNASLMVFRTYGTGLPEFRALFEKCGRDWTRFWTKVRTIDGKKFPRPQDEEFPVVLKREAESGC